MHFRLCSNGCLFCGVLSNAIMVAVIKMGAYIHGVLILCGYLLSQFYEYQLKTVPYSFSYVQFVCILVMTSGK